MINAKKPQARHKNGIPVWDAIFYWEMRIMRYIEKTGRDALTKLALRSGKPREQICAEIQEAIDAAWASQDLTAQVLQKELFPNGRPSPEEFVSVLAHKSHEKG